MRVYVLDANDAVPLKKLLEYDPYLDFNLIPRIPKEWDDEKYLKAHPDMAKEAEDKKKQANEAMKKLREDKDANIIFARQDYQLKDGISLGLDRDKYYLYLNAHDDFIIQAEEKLKRNIASIKRVDENLEKQIIDTLEKERERSEQGLGLIFG